LVGRCCRAALYIWAAEHRSPTKLPAHFQKLRLAENLPAGFLRLDITLKGDYKVIIVNLIAIKDLKQPRRLKERLQAEKELLLTCDGRPVAVLVNVDNAEDPESILQSIRDSRSRLALSRIRETARRTGVSRFTPEQIDREIAAARKAHKTRR
jgi:antitoxin (DNA-binding transcriptional repressor) of toxin-antitoxin stability system